VPVRSRVKNSIGSSLLGTITPDCSTNACIIRRPLLTQPPPQWRGSYNSAQTQIGGHETKRPSEPKRGRSYRTFEPSSQRTCTSPPRSNLPITSGPSVVKGLQTDRVLFCSAVLKKLISESPSMSEQELAAAGELGALATFTNYPPQSTRRKPSGYLLSTISIDSACPICFVPFSAILAEHEMAAAMDSPAHPIEELGIMKLSKTCGHIFCRKE